MNSDSLNPVFLRPLAAADLDRIYRWHNDPLLYEHLVGTYRQVSRNQVEQWLQQRLENASFERNFAICETATAEHRGNLYLRDVDFEEKCAELHIFIGEAVCRGRGLGTGAVRRAIELALGSERLRRLYLHVLATNTSAIRVYEKCGFRTEKRLPSLVEKRTGPVDVLLMELKLPGPPR